MSTTTFLVRISVTDDVDDYVESLHPEIAMLELLSSANSEQHCEWEIVTATDDCTTNAAQIRNQTIEEVAEHLYQKTDIEKIYVEDAIDLIRDMKSTEQTGAGS